ncbi:MAG: efflux RND transporter periplasmic adaptor subunit [Opitutaceae bacterium]|nr:efflux RND transporter periplasmic adaptor subunit [Opitutaceae bacterium]
MAKSRNSGGLIITLVIIAAAAAGGWYFWSQGAEKPPEYTTVAVARGDLTQTVTATGDLQPVLNVSVSSQISGIVQKLYVDWNSPVKAGQLLAELDPSTYQTALQQVEGQLANAKASDALMKANADRSRGLYKQQLVTQSELDTAEAQLAQADAQVQIQNANYQTAKVNLSRCTIYSPIDGIVISRSVDVGNTVAASLSAPTLFQIANDLTNMRIAAAISEADIGSVQEKQLVNFTVDAYPNRQFRGVVSQIRNSPKTQQNVVIYDTMIDVRNEDLKLKPGMTANVSIVVASRTGALKVANAAIRARVPENLLPPKAEVPGKSAAKAKPVSDDERRKQMQQLMADAGFTRGSGPPSAEVRAKMEQLAMERGIELPTGRFGGERDRGGVGNAPVTRTLYLLVGIDPKTAHPEPVTVKLGITDGVATEVVDGLKESDVVITAVAIPGAKPATAPASNPFGGGGRAFGGR